MPKLTLYLDNDDERVDVSAYDSYSMVKMGGFRLHVDKYGAARAVELGEALITEARKYLPPPADAQKAGV